MSIRSMVIVICVALLLSPVVVCAADTKTQAPFAGLPGALLMWWICSRRKARPIGGWLLYFYIQLYGGAAVAILLIALSSKNYNPAIWGSSSLYGLYLIGTLPAQLLLIAEVVIGSVLLKKRQWKWVNYLRLAFALDVSFAVLSILIDAAHFESGLPFDFLTLAVSIIWLMYFLRSERVRAVFKTKLWPVASMPVGVGPT